MKLLSIAFRNIGRKRVRSAITIGAMAFAGFIMLFFAALGAGFVHSLEKNAVGMSLGDIQIHAPGYRSDPDLYKAVPDPAGVVKKLEAAGFAAAPRLYGFGLAAAGSASSGIWLRGVDLVNEPKVTSIHGHIKEGLWLDDGDPKGVVLGKKLAHTLGVNLGDEVVVVSQASDGSMANDLYRVRGVLKAVGEAADQTGFLMTEAEFRRLMAIPEGTHEIAVVRTDKNRDLAEASRAAEGAAPGMEIKTWRELQPIIAQMLDVMGTSLIIMLSIAYSAVGMVILNATLMNVFERIREFGVMKAIGVPPRQVFSLIIAEALIEAVIANALALALGVPVVLHYQEKGIDLSKITPGADLAGVAFDPILYCQLTTQALATPVWFMFVVVALAVLYPATKAALIRPLEALHHQ